MTGRVQSLRSSVAGNRPTGRQPGEVYTNWADAQMGVINATNGAQDLIAVRFFSTLASYVIGDCVVQAGQIYRAIAASSPGAFVPANWAKISTAQDLASLQTYVDTGDATVLGVANTKLPLAGGTLTGPLILAADPTVALGAATKQYVDSIPTNSNRIINGDMRIDQRNSGASGTAAGYMVDRWAYTNSTAPTGRGAWQGFTATPGGQLSTLGFGYYLSFTSSGAYTPAAADNFSFFQAIEADMVTDLLWGMAGAQSVTLSFLANSSLTGQFGGAITNARTGTRCYPFSFNLPVANTWTKISITIPGDTAAGWTMSGNGIGVAVRFDLGSGANFRAAAGAWTAGDIRGATGDVNVVGTNGANFSLTGVKLELGSAATPFNRKTTQESLADCQRYCYRVGSTTLQSLGAGYSPTATLAGVIVSFPVTMRVNPTMSVSSGAGFTVNGAASSAVAAAANGVGGVQVNITTSGQGAGAGVTANVTANNWIGFDAEL